MKTRAIAIDVFCGAGGLSLGLCKSGFEVGFAIDINRYGVETYGKNFSHPVMCGDVRQVNFRKLISEAGLSVEEIVLLAGGPPCQGFSIQRRGPDSDLRNNLVFEFLRLVRDIQPRFFLLENVPGLKNVRGKDYLHQLIGAATKLGYHCHTQILNAADFGVAQIRKRLFVVGERTQGSLLFEFPKPLVRQANWITVRKALKGLPSPPDDYTPHPLVFNHQKSRMSKLNIKRISYVPQGCGWEHIPKSLRVPCHEPGSDRIGHRYVYGRLSWQDPAGTITARFDSFTRGKFAHPSEDRSITLREGARLQSFPDDFDFVGPKEEIAAQIGNAVPPLLAEAIGRAILIAYEKAEGKFRREVRPSTRSSQETVAVMLRQPKLSGYEG